MKEIKVLYLFNSVDGGTGTYLETLLQLKKLSDDKVIKKKILVINKPKYREVKSHDYIYFSNSKIFNHEKVSFLDAISLIKKALWFKDGVRKYKPDVVFSDNPYSILISEFCKIIFKFEYKTVDLVQNNLTEVINYKVPIYLRFLIRNILRILFIKSDSLVTDSEGLSKGMVKMFRLPRVPKTMSSFVSRRHITNFKNHKKHSKLSIVSVGRLDAQKDFETLIQAFYIVTKKISNTELIIVGDGPLRTELEFLANKLGLGRQIKFLGWIQNPHEVLKKSDLFVFASRWESFGLSLVEAMSCGLPVVSSNCSYGPPEILDKNKYGLLVSVGNASDMSKAIVSLLLDTRKRKHYSKMALKRSKYYSKKRMLTKFDAILTDVLSDQQIS